ncbi:MAG: gliding motility-associated C-terminal domain-containing protein [Saprospiraceae bacterium]|nr:gliding motility-associated C-terminal domain-containing protein [Saprospiraceae bacterium]
MNQPFVQSTFLHKQNMWFMLLFLGGLPLSAQNLLPDGSFEKLLETSCQQPDKNFEQHQFWYALNASPDLFKNNCPIDETRSIFWDAALRSYHGNNFVGISSRWNSNATYVSEGIATSLNSTLEDGKTYFLEMAVRNRGGFQGLDETIARCALKPNQHLDIYLSKDSIFITNDFSFGTASINARLVAVLNSEVITSTLKGNWEVISTCFEAQAGEKYLAIVMPLGTFGDLPACAAQASSGVFRSFYYNLDDVQLTASPNRITRKVSFCENEVTTVNLLDLFGDETSLSDATFVWEDGEQQLSRTFEIAGTYAAQAILPCGIVPLEIELQPKFCESIFFAPTAFSPNGDGQNDSFQLQFPADIEIKDFNFSVFDRWGNKVFQSHDVAQSWNGTANKADLSTGIHAWQVSCRLVTLKGEIQILESGSVMLIR